MEEFAATYCAAVSCKTYEPHPFDHRQRACAIFLCDTAFSKFCLLTFYFFSLSEPISYGRTQQRHITKDMGFLSYPASAIVTVLAKGAYFGESGDEFWEAEVRKKIFCIISYSFFCPF